MRAMALCSRAQAAETQIKLVNQGVGRQTLWRSTRLSLRSKPGDSIKFVAADPGHMAGSIEGMAAGGARSRSRARLGKNVTVTFDKPGDLRRGMYAAFHDGHDGARRGRR